MSSAVLANAGELAKMTVEFPNLFGGTEITYRRGFEVFGVPIYWYGILIAVGVILAYFYAMHRATKDFGLVKDRVFDVAFVCIVGGFLFARIYYCVFVTLDPNNDTNYDFVTTFTKIRDGGIAMYGGTIGAVLIGIFMCKFRKVNFFAMVDLASLGFLIGQTIGRWGNFINQEAYGAECDKNWLFAMTGNAIKNDIPAGAYVHPCFLYESVWCLLGFIFLHIYSKKLRTFDGEVGLLYLIWYGSGRAVIEQLRTDSLYAGPLKVSQLVGIVSAAAALVCFVIFKIKTNKSGKPLYVNSDASAALIESDLKAEQEAREKKKKKGKLADVEDGDEVSSEEKAEETEANSEEKAEKKSEEKAEEKSEKKSEKKAKKKSEETPDEKTEEKSEEKPEEKSEEKSEEKTEEKSGDKKEAEEKKDGGEDN